MQTKITRPPTGGASLIKKKKKKKKVLSLHARTVVAREFLACECTVIITMKIMKNLNRSAWVKAL